jgi:5-methyltetrahydrofolate--homocysteine methyltransferase
VANTPKSAVLEALLAERGWLLADGATGTNLFDMGLTSGEAPETWLTLHPDRIISLHRQFLDAGADIILTNSFGANRRRLALHKLEQETRSLNRRAAELAREAAARAGRPVVVAGSVGPTGDLLAPLGPLTEDEAVGVFAEQIDGLKEGGADIVWIETMSALEEMRAAARAAALVSMPYTVTASFDTAGRTMMGITPAAFATATAAFDPPPRAIGSNCGVGAADLVLSILGIASAGTAALIIAKANCGIPRVEGSQVLYSGTPDLMGTYARLAYDAGARIIGGCCGTRPAHLAAMYRALDGYRGEDRPDLDRIISLLGPLVSPPKEATGERRRARRS